MPIPLGLTEAEMRDLKQILSTSHRISIGIQLMDLSHNHLNDLSDKLMSGQVNIDSQSEVSRSLDLQLIDPNHKLQLDDDNTEDGSLYMTRMIRVIYRVINIDRTKVFDIPVFCGPINKVDRQGPIINVECQGKERLAMNSVWKGRTFKKGRRRTQVIASVMTDAGEASKKMDIPTLSTTLPKAVSANRKITFWALSKKMAAGLNRQLFYDGRGQLRLRLRPQKTVFTFDETVMTTTPTVTYDAQDLSNAVEVLGGKAKKAKRKTHYRLVAPRAHPFSPWRLGRNNTPRYLPFVIEDDSIKSLKDARRIAKATLRDLLVQSIEVTFDSLPIPFLEEGDLCRFTCFDASGSFRITKMTIPLTAGGKSSIGYLRRTSLSHRSLKTKKSKKGSKK